MDTETGVNMDEADCEPEEETTGKRDQPEHPLPEPVSESPGSDEQMRAYEELNDRFLRLAADFENFRKRVLRDQDMMTALANERFAIDLLEVADNFDRALKSDDSHLREGLLQIRDLLGSQLGRHGVTPIDAHKKRFNPEEHEAIAYLPSDEPDGTVIDEVTKGYRLKGKVIRHAKVAVSKGNTDNQR